MHAHTHGRLVGLSRLFQLNEAYQTGHMARLVDLMWLVLQEKRNATVWSASEMLCSSQGGVLAVHQGRGTHDLHQAMFAIAYWKLYVSTGELVMENCVFPVGTN